MNELSSLGLIDSHAHIQGSEYASEVEAVVKRAQEAGVERIIVVGGAGELSSNEAAVSLAESHPALYATVGMHPHDAKDVGEQAIEKLKKLTARAKVIAVGEAGLDFYYNHSPQEVQRTVFARFIRMAGPALGLTDSGSGFYADSWTYEPKQRRSRSGRPGCSALEQCWPSAAMACC